MRDAVIAAAVRSPIGKRNGGLAHMHAVALSALVLRELAERTGMDPALVDDVHWGNVISIGQQSGNVGRMAVLGAGWPESIPGFTVDRQCGSSQQAISTAAAAVISGQSDVVIAGGVEMMSGVPMGVANVPGTGDMGGPAVERYATELTAPGFNGRFNQGAGAEMIAEKYGFSRTQLDEYSVQSHELAAAAQDAGLFVDEIATVPTDSGSVTADEGIRRGSTVEKLGTLKAPFLDNGKITAGNASQISDGAAAVLITSSQRAAELGLTPIARVHTAVCAGDDPVKMLTGPIPATRLALKRSGLSIDDIGLFEVNEAFAPVPMAWQTETGVSRDRVNLLGGAIALGHPLGCSGARLATTLIHHMRRTGTRYGLQTMCEGGGTANATIYELID
ncbi:thiolase family protein [Mycobacterium sp. CBMA293]|uniref:thiolase family protein n=1 Tax=unclassified Mycolicibacterium TaxID=2636767 RepID=UPI0012DE5D54|nr:MULTISPECIES: thiolase family protein [unclassified Mycolicibacterium]MUL46946.1 thiolase family protein [Mycolicibacterium sp. CBMA 360]MUL57267.1 thiolase family protein [Mycolicibacterium sp. CBMA 335]MUL70307.1 thiolase family protein [Mycolicibacterium sp. CBMA 311]MUL92355.1 thiolase family protein [Mycolicibacterium sp. CBMA 230]MUM06776.1 acetyl-CoA acetyltransferase [Mycolicibacterium sp. CBMA 213]